MNSKNEKMDISYLRELSEGDLNFELQILSVFVKETPGDIEKLEVLVDKSEHGKIAALIHSVKSKLGILGLIDLFNTSDKLEKKFKTLEPLLDDMYLLKQFIIDLKASVYEVQIEIQKRQSV